MVHALDVVPHCLVLLYLSHALRVRRTSRTRPREYSCCSVTDSRVPSAECHRATKCPAEVAGLLPESWKFLSGEFTSVSASSPTRSFII